MMYALLLLFHRPWPTVVISILYHGHQATLHTSNRNHIPKQQHYSDVIMSAMASQITSLTIVYPTVYTGADQRKHQSSTSPDFVLRVIGLHAGNSLVTQRASNAENVSIWWRHHEESHCEVFWRMNLFHRFFAQFSPLTASIWPCFKRCFFLWPLLLTWFNFNPSMDK